MVTRPAQIDAVAELQNTFSVLFKNWILAVPTAVVSLIAAAFFVFMLAGVFAAFTGAGAMGGMNAQAALALLASSGVMLIVGLIVIILLSMLANAVVLAAAENVWHGGSPDLGAGVSKGLSKLPALLVLFLIFAVIGIVVVPLMAVLIGIPIAIILGFFFMYTLPAIVVGDRGAVEAMRESWNLVRANFGTSAMAFLGIAVVNIVGGIVRNLFHAIPFLTVIVWFVVGGIVAAYSALVLVRFYDLLRGSAATPATIQSSGPTI